MAVELSPSSSDLEMPADSIVEYSHDLIAATQARSGAYPASPTHPAYAGYCWLRDGSFTADAMSTYGDVHSATRFFDWCARAILANEETIEQIAVESAMGEWRLGCEMMPARFTLDGDIVSEDCRGGFAIDGYGAWLWALEAHCTRHGLDPERWAPAVALTVSYLRATWTRPCFDWWGQQPERRHTSTLLTVAAGLRASTRLLPMMSLDADTAADQILETVFRSGIRNGHLSRTLETAGSDASLAAAIAPFRVIAADSPLAHATIGSIERSLTNHGGVHRFLGDTYYGGGEWPMLSCLLGLAHLEVGNVARARALLAWAVGTAAPNGDLPEQVASELQAPMAFRRWEAQAGPSAQPLLASHALVMSLAMRLDEVAGPESDADADAATPTVTA